ncbi:MAG: DUF1007 family protein [Spirochaetales bacterium]|uniref:DUF1007 family protein n=1 Tax=Candidatus Thalassospirochaeta sargassi TaxID=3119039 RepID=A0AAJ1ICX3_9SPIO|nr:DUF1007 family protein [Spirochaetales bacterium]
MRKFFTAVLLILLVPAAVLSAHPHMFIDMKLSPVFSEDGFEGVNVDWLFDMVFTGSVLMDNGIGWTDSLNNEEIEIIKDTSFVNLINYNYFTYFNVGGKMSRAETYRDFTAYMSENRLGYRFFLPYEGRRADSDIIRIAVYDETFFCDIAFTDSNPVELSTPGNIKVEWQLSEVLDAPIFYDNTAQMVSRDGEEYSGQAFPVELVLTRN